MSYRDMEHKNWPDAEPFSKNLGEAAGGQVVLHVAREAAKKATFRIPWPQTYAKPIAYVWEEVCNLNCTLPMSQICGV